MTTSPQNPSYSQTLIQAGLNQDQAVVYEILLKNGSLPAGKIHQKTPLKRGLVYKVLGELVNLGLVAKKELPGKVAIFEPAHPLKLKELAEEKEKQAKQAQTVIESVLGQLTSEYNLISGKPGVQFYEGKEGVKKTAWDSLNSKTPIYSYIDNEAVKQFIPDINEEYVKKRNDLKIEKKMLIVESELMRKKKPSDYDLSTTQIRLIDAKYLFATVMMIYDDKVSYLTLDKERLVGIIIQDAQITQMHRVLFEYAWEKSKPLFPNIGATPQFASAGSSTA